jgi:hypothetical protein
MATPESDLATTFGDYDKLDVTHLIHTLYIDVEGQITRADTKSQLVLSAGAILLAVFFESGVGLPERAQGPLTLGTAAMLGLGLLILVLLLASVFFALSAAYPRRPNVPATPKLFYTASIVHFPPHAYVDAFKAMTVQELKDTVLQEIHGKSRVVVAKFANLQRSMVFMYVALLLWVVLQLVGYRVG